MLVNVDGTARAALRCAEPGAGCTAGPAVRAVGSVLMADSSVQKGPSPGHRLQAGGSASRAAVAMPLTKVGVRLEMPGQGSGGVLLRAPFLTKPSAVPLEALSIPPASGELLEELEERNGLRWALVLLKQERSPHLSEGPPFAH